MIGPRSFWRRTLLVIPFVLIMILLFREYRRAEDEAAMHAFLHEALKSVAAANPASSDRLETLFTLLDRDVDRRFPSRRDLRAEVRDRLAEAAYAMHDYKWAAENYYEAYHEGKGPWGLTDRRALKALVRYARCAAELGFVNWTTYGSLTSGLASLDQYVGREDPLTCEAIAHWGRYLELVRYFEQAELHYRLALEGMERVHGERSLPVLTCLESLARVAVKRGQWDEAEPILERAWKLSRDLRGEAHPRHIDLMLDRTILFASTGRPAEAARLLDEAVGRHERYAVPANTSHDAETQRVHLAKAELAVGRLVSAERRSRELAERLQAANRSETWPPGIVNIARNAQTFVGSSSVNDPVRFEEDLSEGVRKMGMLEPETRRIRTQVLRALGKPGEAAEQLRLIARAVGSTRLWNFTDDDLGLNVASEAAAAGAFREAAKLLLEMRGPIASYSTLCAPKEERARARRVQNALIDVYEAWGERKKADACRRDLARIADS